MPDGKTIHFLSADDVAFIRELRKWLAGITGPGVIKNSPGVGVVIGGGAPPAPPAMRNDRVAILFLVGPEEGGGKYQCRVLGPPMAKMLATGTLSASEIGVDDVNGPLVRAANTYEIGQDTHDLETDATYSPQIFPGIFVGFDVDGVACYSITVMQWQNCVTETQPEAV